MPRLPLFCVPHSADEAAVLAPVLASGRLAGGPLVTEFEAKLAERSAVPACVATYDNSSALSLALRLVGVGSRDEVAVSPMACAATVMPITMIGARPRWIDVDPRTGMPTASHLIAGLTPSTKALVVYHWAGDVAPLAELDDACRDRGIALIQDASAAFDATYRDRPIAAAGGQATIQSFYPTRPLSTAEGGAVLIADRSLIERSQRLRRFGIEQRTFRLPSGDLNPASDIPEASGNAQMGSLAAALGLRQLADAGARVRRNQAVGTFYDDVLRNVPGLTLLDRPAERKSSYWAYALRAENRDGLVRKLTEHGIGAQRLHLRVDAYSCFDGIRRDDLEGVDVFDRENVAIPCGWWLSDEGHEEIVACLKSGW